MNFYNAGILPTTSLATTRAAEPARQAASPGLPGCWPGWAVPAPATCGGGYIWERGGSLLSNAAGSFFWGGEGVFCLILRDVFQ